MPSSEPGPDEIYERYEFQQELQELLTTLSPEFLVSFGVTGYSRLFLSRNCRTDGMFIRYSGNQE